MSAPDYVFEAFFDKETFMKENKGTAFENYRFMDLNELGQYLQVNNQLPPSIIQGNFSMDGSNNLVQQQYYLLEKLEEQSIYIIQLKEEKDREISSLKQENEAIKQLICPDHPQAEFCS